MRTKYSDLDLCYLSDVIAAFKETISPVEVLKARIAHRGREFCDGMETCPLLPLLKVAESFQGHWN